MNDNRKKGKKTLGMMRVKVIREFICWPVLIVLKYGEKDGETEVSRERAHKIEKGEARLEKKEMVGEVNTRFSFITIFISMSFFFLHVYGLSSDITDSRL